MKKTPTSIKTKGKEHLNQDLMGGSDSRGLPKLNTHEDADTVELGSIQGLKKDRKGQ